MSQSGLAKIKSFGTMVVVGAGGLLAIKHHWGCAMTTIYSQIRAQFDELKAGDRVEVEHVVAVGQRSWTAKTCGTVVRTERQRHGLHFQRNHDDKVYSDVVLLELPDGELTSVAIDEFTTIRRAN